MADSKHRAVWDWLLGCPYIQDLFFNFAQSDDGDAALVPSEAVLQEFIDGSSLRSSDVTITRAQTCSFEPNDPENIAQLERLDLLRDWLETQGAAGSFPEFPVGEYVQELYLLPGEDGFADGVDGGCRYLLRLRIEYLKEA